MDRRSTLKVFSGLLALWPAALLGQSPKRVPIIGVPLVYARDNDEIMVALRKGLRDRGYVDGENIRIEHRFAYGRMERVPALVQELVKLKADVDRRGQPAEEEGMPPEAIRVIRRMIPPAYPEAALGL